MQKISVTGYPLQGKSRENREFCKKGILQNHVREIWGIFQPDSWDKKSQKQWYINYDKNVYLFMKTILTLLNASNFAIFWTCFKDKWSIMILSCWNYQVKIRDFVSPYWVRTLCTSSGFRFSGPTDTVPVKDSWVWRHLTFHLHNHTPLSASTGLTSHRQGQSTLNMGKTCKAI